MKYFFTFMRIFLLINFFAACSTTQVKQNEAKIESNSIQAKKIMDESSSQDAKRSQAYFPIVRNKDVEKWISYFQTKGKRTLSQWMKQGEPFREAIEEALKNEGVPVSLYYLSLIESGFVHNAQSKAKASGPWQFIKGTGSLYGLQSDQFVDERRDPVKSTHAAAAYLRDLRMKFGDWYLAVAAYNGGPRTINHAVKKAGSRDFWKLKQAGLLKKETGEFVPKMIAAAIIGKDPSSYGFDVSALSKVQEFPHSAVEVKYAVRLSDLAKKLSIPLSKLKEWNPELIKGVIPQRRLQNKNTYALRLGEDYHGKYNEIESQLSKLQVKQIHIHKVVKGETLAKLARQCQIPLNDLLKANPNLQAKRMRIGTEVAMPCS